MTRITAAQDKKGIGILASFFVAIGTFMIYRFFEFYNSDSPSGKTDLLFFFGLFAYYLSYRVIIFYIRRSPNITIDNETIQIKNEIYYWKDLQDVKLNDKKSFGFFNNQLDVTTLTFPNKTEYIFKVYNNSSEIKSFIQQIVIDKKDVFHPIVQNKALVNIGNETFRVFKGNPIFSARGLLMWGLIGSITFMLLFTEGKISKIDQIKAFVPLCTFWFLINAYGMHYFQISKNYFVVKNPYLLWVNKTYNISDIEEIVFETGLRRPNTLKIITKDFKEKPYPAATLLDNKWLEMKKQLESQNITVRNECIPEK